MNRNIIFLWIFCLSGQAVFSQDYSSKNNYTGSWETSASWNQTWTVPQSNVNNLDITINGYITANGSLSFSDSSKLIVDDTLVILGDLIINDNNDVQVNNNGILIVMGNLTISDKTNITADGYIIITGNITKEGSTNNGSFKSNDNPVKVFVGGTILPSSLTINKPDFPALNCTAPSTTPYPNTACSYGNMTDIINDPIYPFFQTTCAITTPTITAGGPTTFCDGGSVTLTSSAGASYLWSNGATTQSINVTTAGSYTVRITNSNSCQSAASTAAIVTVNALPAMPTIAADGPTTFCAGGSVTLTSSAGSAYLWSNTATTQNINVTDSGSYTVQVRDANGCQSAASTVTLVNVNALPVVYAGRDTTIPNGTTTTIDATVTGNGPFTYSWSPSAQLLDALIEDPTTVNLATTTIYTLTVTSITTLCSNTDAVKISISGGALSSISTATPDIICAGANVQLEALTGGGSGFYSYTWTSFPEGFTSSVENPKVNPAINTAYFVAVFDGFNTVNSQVDVMVNAIPETPTITTDGPTTFCDGGSVTLTSGAGTGYLWSNGETAQSIKVSSSGSYTVRITNANGCLSAASEATLVTVYALPFVPTITADSPTTFCDGGSVNLTSSEGANHLWSNGATTQSINVTTAGSYTVRITNSSGCQSAASTSAIVTVNALPATPVITADGPTTFCAGESITLNSSAGSTYLWSTGATFKSITVTITGSYTVQVTDINGCQSEPSVATIVTVNALPFVNITSSSSSICVGDLRTLSGIPAGGRFVIADGPGAISGNILSATESGNINLEYYYTDVCTNKATQLIIVNENPDAFAGPDQELRYVFETQMKAELSSSETGEWSLLSGSGRLSDIHSPIASVTELSTGENIFLWIVQNGNCQASATVKITVFNMFIPSVITPNDDGKNDHFIISGGDEKIELVIFNRWGNVEYSNDNYLNDWNGKNNSGAELPNDTYFYVVKFKNGEINKGSVLIKR